MKLFFRLIIFLFSVNAVGQSLETDRLALIDLYNATDGALWVNRNSWQIPGYVGESPCGWFGVTCESGRVTELKLPNNNLVGTIPNSIGDLTSLKVLQLNKNKLSGLLPYTINHMYKLVYLYVNDNQLSGYFPNLSEIPLTYTVNVENNRFTFEGMESTVHKLDLYAPQAKIPISYNGWSLTVNAGGSMSNNTYNWYRNGALIASNTNVNSYSTSVDGTYRVEVTNRTATQLTLVSENYIIGPVGPVNNLESDRLALISLYNSTNGGQWNNRQGWNVPGNVGDNPCGWAGVKCQEGRVTSLEMFANNLSGNIPSEIGNLSKLKSLRLNSNYLTGSIPTSITSLNLLEALALAYNQLSGVIPAEIANLSRLKILNLSANRLFGSIPVELSNLSSLDTLMLNVNRFSGLIPAQLGNLSQLKSLRLNNNELSGEIPFQLGSLIQLRSLELSSNQLSGSIPFQIGYLSQLEELSLSRNVLSGVIPVQLMNLTKLKSLSASENFLSGSIPASISNLTSLKSLALYNNSLWGNIPASIGQLLGLVTLYLDHNSFTGNIPTELGNLVNLQLIMLSHNQLTGSIPGQLANLKSLNSLYLDHNHLSGNLPSMSNFRDATWITINDNQYNFQGIESNSSKLDVYFPQAALLISNNNGLLSVEAGGQMSNNTYRWYKDGVLIATNYFINTYSIPGAGSYRVEVTNINLSGFKLTSEVYQTNQGTLETDRLALVALYNATNGVSWTNRNFWNVPGSVGDNPCGWYGISCTGNRVTSIAMFNNNLSGPIPVELGQLNELRSLTLENNKLTGSLPAQLGNLTSLRNLSFSGNQLSGSIPPELGNLVMLEQLSLFYNKLNGNIPPRLGGLINLVSIFLDGNELTGSIPAELGNMQSLRYLGLYQNRLTGSIPYQLSYLTKLEVLNLGSNQLSGRIPAEFEQLKTLTNLSLSNNLLSESIPPSLAYMSSLKYLFLDYNKLTGSLPASLGQMSNLLQLTLSNNLLSGNIPKEFETIYFLNTLDISFNNLSGSFPSSLLKMSKLQYLNMESNQFGGTIPDLAVIPVTAYIYIGRNKFTFDGLESNISKIDNYAPQATITITKLGNIISANAGETRSQNNNYRWFKDGMYVSTTVGNNSFNLTGNGTYYVEVRNGIAPALTLTGIYVHNNALPVTLISFTGRSTAAGNLLKWSTTSETNNDGFEIERSIDAKLFEKIGYVDGKGESATLQSYQFSDQNPLPISYYRLKQLDHDGKFEHSRIIQVRLEIADLKVYPNPVKGKLTVESSQNKNIQIYNLKGAKVFEELASPVHTISTANWQTGVYLIKVGDETEKIVVEN